MSGAKGNKSLNTALRLLEVIADSRGQDTLQVLSQRTGIPLPTAWRMASTMVERGFLRRGKRGYYLPGVRLRQLAETVSDTDTLTLLSRPLLKNLANKFDCVAHLGALNDDMVTYLVREGSEDSDVPTQEGTQLEGYCSAIGKVLLSERSVEEIAAYLSDGAFIPLTPYTITDPKQLKEELELVAQRGFAIDAQEVQENMTCLALPLRNSEDQAVAAISLSQTANIPSPVRQRNMLRHLRRTAESIMSLI